MSTEVRKAYVAGKFYPGSVNEIYDLIENIRQHEMSKIHFESAGKTITGAVLPHAGHIYSGYQTIPFFEALLKSQQNFDVFVILHPIHRGGIPDFGTDINKYWRTPLGKLELDHQFIDMMDIPRSEELHKWEHSAEVLLPFIQYYHFGDKKIVPVGICWQHPESSRLIAQKIKIAEEKTGKNALILASSDFSHFLDPETGRIQDDKAIYEILDLNPEGLYSAVTRNNISICGFGPIMSLLYYANSLNKNIKAEVIARGHSGEIYPSASVVDYVSIIIYY